MSVTAQVERRPFRSAGIGASYSTDLGPGVEPEFDHRNLFDVGETHELKTDISLEEQCLEGRLAKP